MGEVTAQKLWDKMAVLTAAVDADIQACQAGVDAAVFEQRDDPLAREIAAARDDSDVRGCRLLDKLTDLRAKELADACERAVAARVEAIRRKQHLEEMRARLKVVQDRFKA